MSISQKKLLYNQLGGIDDTVQGYRDLEYLKLKIYDLPKLRIIKDL